MKLSVIIPTHNRFDILMRTLDALGAQTLASSEFEVIVVTDGCTDGTLRLLERYKPSYQLTFVDQTPGRGPGAALNLAATRARAEVLMLLDDDMEASPQLLSKHLDAHCQQPGGVVLGYFPMQPHAPGDDAFTDAARTWWTERFAARARPGYRYTCVDFCGNVSLPTALFRGVGGFDEQFDWLAAGEDYELGYRLISRGARFQFVLEAASIHHALVPLESSLRRAEQEGFGHSLIVRKHPELFSIFNISRLKRFDNNVAIGPLWCAVWKWPALARAPAAVLKACVRSFASLEMPLLVWKSYPLLRGYYYWKGVRSAFKTLAAWEAFAHSVPMQSPRSARVDDQHVDYRDCHSIGNSGRGH